MGTSTSHPILRPIFATLTKFDIHRATFTDDTTSTGTAPTALTSLGTNVEQSLATFDSRIPAHKTKEALVDFQELVCLLDVYLKKDVRLYNSYRGAGGCEIPHEITFENLWMIFGPDDLVYCHAQKPHGTVKVRVSDDEKVSNLWEPRRVEVPQAYRVLASCGALRSSAVEKKTFASVAKNSSKPVQKADESQKNASSMREKFNPFYLDCYFVDFDGTKFVVGLNGFEIKPYMGKKKITSLEVCPLRFRDGSGQASHARTDLAQRGKDFLALTLVSHKNFDGTSFGDRKEEVSSRRMTTSRLTG